MRVSTSIISLLLLFTFSCRTQLLDEGGVADPNKLTNDGAVTVEDDGGTADSAGPHCGNGVLDPSEECDATLTTSRNCEDLGYSSGLLTCNSNCRWDVSQCVDTLWPKRLTGIASGAGFAVATDLANNVFIGGNYSDGADLGNGPISPALAQGALAGFVTKFDDKGRYLWAWTFGTSGIASVKAMATDKDNNVLVTGYVTAEAAPGSDPGADKIPAVQVFIAKLSGAGEVLWQKRLGYQEIPGGDWYSESGNNIAVFTDGSIVVTGNFRGELAAGGPVLTSDGRVDFFALKLSPSGEHLWSKNFVRLSNAVDIDGIDEIVLDAASNIYLAGWDGDIVDFGGGPLGQTMAHDETFPFLVKLAPSGGLLWAKSFNANAFFLSMTQDQQGNLVVLGDLVGEGDFGGGTISSGGSDSNVPIRLEYDRDGNYLFGKSYESYPSEPWSGPRIYLAHATHDDMGNLLVTGPYHSPYALDEVSLPDTGSDCLPSYLAAFAPSRTPLMTTRIRGGPFVDAHSLAVDHRGNAFVVGSITDTVDPFGDGCIAGGSPMDGYIDRYHY